VNPDWRNRYETAIAATSAASKVALRYFDGTFTVETKADESPVTVADRETETLLRKTLAAAFPGDGFLGEEHGAEPGTTGYRWIIDPIDGTRNFIRGIPIWGTLVGLEYKGELIAGVIEAPGIGHQWRALRGDGAFHNSRAIRVSPVSDMSKAAIFYTSLPWFQKANRVDEFLEFTRRSELQRGFGDFYGHVLVAQGSGELMIEYGVHIWDVAAIKPIVEEAGGRFTNWDGGNDLERPDVLISNGRLHDEALAILAGKSR
jgi:histidinol-phosphatase